MDGISSRAKRASSILTATAFIFISACGPQQDGITGGGQLLGDVEEFSFDGPVPEDFDEVPTLEVERFLEDYRRNFLDPQGQTGAGESLDPEGPIFTSPVPAAREKVESATKTPPQHGFAGTGDFPPAESLDTPNVPASPAPPVAQPTRPSAPPRVVPVPAPQPAAPGQPPVTAPRSKQIGYGNSFYSNILVKFYPLQSSDIRSGDPFRSNAGLTEMSFENPQGLIVRDSKTGQDLLKANKVKLNFTSGTASIDGGQTATVIGVAIVPVNAAQPTRVWGLVNSRTGRDGTFEYLGQFIMRRADGPREQANSNGWLVLNRVNFEDYINSVTVGEIDGRWLKKEGFEMVRAQAIAARTYAARMMISARTGRNWDVRPTTADQVYVGVTPMLTQVKPVIANTLGKVVWYGNSPALTVYSSNSGGFTCSSRDCWGQDVPYLRGKADVDGVVNMPGGYRMQQVAKANLANVLRQMKAVEFPISQNVSLVVAHRDLSSRVIQVRADDSGQSEVLSAVETEKVLNAIRVGAKRYFDTGSPTATSVPVRIRGLGHRVGMSQWGGYLRSAKGENAESILKYYYEGATVRSL